MPNTHRCTMLFWLKVNLLGINYLELAGTTGLEPATSCVTGMRSNQLNYVPGGINSLSHWVIASLRQTRLQAGGDQ
jgi:hypothetical protein